MTKITKGFTIVELLVAIVIIGILGTLAIVSYTSIIGRTYVAAVKSDLFANDKKAKAYLAQYGSFPTSMDANYCPTAPVVDKNYCFTNSSTTSFTYYVGASSTYTFSMGPADPASSYSKYVITEKTTPTAYDTFAFRLDKDNGVDDSNTVIYTSDGGIAIGGIVDGYYSPTGDSPPCTAGGCLGTGQALIAKFNSKGALSWARGWDNSSQEDETTKIRQLSDQSYIISGTAHTSGISNNDAMLVKLSSTGSILWSKLWGSSTNSDFGSDVIATTDGGFLLAGTTWSYGSGGSDAFIAKFDSSGNLSWSKTWGGSSNDTGESVTQVNDGGFVLGGKYGTTGNPFIAKFDSSGNITWSKSWPVGFGNYSSLLSLSSDNAGGVVVTSLTSTYGSGGNDAYIAKFDSSGGLSWIKTWGGSGDEIGYSVIQTSDLGYVITGSTSSYGNGGVDAFLAKFDSSGNLSWSKTFGSSGFEVARGVSQNADGGYLISGSTDTYDYQGDVFVAKYDSAGDIPNCSKSICSKPNAIITSPQISASNLSISIFPQTITLLSPSVTGNILSPVVTYITQ